MMRTIGLIASLMLAAPAFAAPGAKTPAAPKNGEMAPDFTLTGVDGKEYKLSQFKGKTVVLEWFNNDCPYVKKHYDGTGNMQALQKQVTAKGDVWLTIASSAKGKEGHLDATTGQKIRTDRKMASTALLLDETGKVGAMYQAKTTPHMYIVDAAGKLVYQGAIDDKPSANERSLVGANNYVRTALKAIDAKQPVPASTASTTPYGCGIKYQ